MERFIDPVLLKWKDDPNRKPLLVRGARQVGKTYSIRQLSKRFKFTLEVNFESDKKVHKIFEKDLDPFEICRNLSAFYNVPVQEGVTLLFFDEIQACPAAISSLRFFHEKRPGLHVVSAGSLLEFALNELTSFGVGRIDSLFMFPLSFDEFLIAIGEEKLYQLKADNSFGSPLSQAIHLKLVDHLRKFLILGGLPEVISTYIKTDSYIRTQDILDRLITGFEDDFSKYKKRVPTSRLREVFRYIVFRAGNQFNYSKASETSTFAQIKESLELLEMAGLAYRVQHTAANGIPLGAEVNQKKFKVILFDHGISQRILGLDLPEYLVGNDVYIINKGYLAEQFAGTEIIKNQGIYSRTQLYYWHREKRGSNAEVDYVIARGNHIIPLEVKSGLQGKMQSLRLFLQEKKIGRGIRVSLENFDRYENIMVLPLYAMRNLFIRSF